MNPWIILAIVMAWAVTCAGAYYKGGEHREAAIKAHYAEQVDQAIKEHNDDAAIDMQAAFEWGQRNSVARARGDTVAAAVNRDAHDNPPPAVCVLPAPTISLLNDAVKAANDIPAAASGVPSPLPDAARTGSGGRDNAASVGSGSAGPGRPVSPAAGRVR